MSAGAAREIEGVQFDRVLHAVDDLGIDPDAREPVARILDDKLDGRTAVEFPPGEYLWETGILTSGTNGIIGLGDSHTDTVFYIKRGGVGRYWRNNGGSPVLKNCSVHMRDDEETLSNSWLYQMQGGAVKDFEILGRIPDESVMDSPGHLFAIGAAESGEVDVDGLACRGGCERVIYPNGAQGIWVTQGHDGILNFNRVHFEGLGSNAFRYTHAYGSVHLTNSLFRNNFNSNVRFYGGRRPDDISSIEGTYFIQDGKIDHLPYSRPDDTMDVTYKGSDGILLSIEGEPRVGGRDLPDCSDCRKAIVRDCDFVMAPGDYNNRMLTRTVSWDVGISDATWVNNRFHSQTGNNFVINAEQWDFEDCHFAGSGGFTGDLFLDNCCAGSNVDLGGVDHRGTTRGGCATPPSAIPQPIEGGESPGPDPDPEPDPTPEPEPVETVLLDITPDDGAGVVNYSFTVDGFVEPGPEGGDFDNIIDLGGGEFEVDAVTSGGNSDDWEIAGTISNWSADQPASVYTLTVDGQPISPSDFPMEVGKLKEPAPDGDSGGIQGLALAVLSDPSFQLGMAALAASEANRRKDDIGL